MTGDLAPEDLERLVAAVAAKLVTLTGLPLEMAEEAALSVVGAVPVGDDGTLTFTDAEGRPVARLPYSAFASLLEPEEDPD